MAVFVADADGAVIFHRYEEAVLVSHLRGVGFQVCRVVWLAEWGRGRERWDGCRGLTECGARRRECEEQKCA